MHCVLTRLSSLAKNVLLKCTHVVSRILWVWLGLMTIALKCRYGLWSSEQGRARKMAVSRMEEKARTCVRCEQVMRRFLVEKVVKGEDGWVPRTTAWAIRELGRVEGRKSEPGVGEERNTETGRVRRSGRIQQKKGRAAGRAFRTKSQREFQCV